MKTLALLLLLFPLFFWASEALVHTTKDGKPYTLESTLATKAIFTPGEEGQCGILYALNITAGCVVQNAPFSAQFNSSAYGALAANGSLANLIPFLFYYGAAKAGCKSYKQAFDQIIPALDDLPIDSRPRVFLVGSAILNFIGFAAEPYGDFDYQNLPYRVVSVSLFSGLYIVQGKVSPNVCVDVEYGYFSRYFLGVGHYFTLVILGAIHAVCLLLNSCEVFLSLKKLNWYRLSMFASACVYSIFRLIDFSWDHRNFFNLMGDHAYQALLWGGYMAVYFANFSLVFMWLTVIKTGSLSSHVRPIISKISTGVIWFTCCISWICCILGALTSTNANLLPIYNAAFIIFVVLDFTVVTFFVSFGFRILLLIREALQAGKNRLILKITSAMMICSLSFLSLTIGATIYSYHLNTRTPFSGSTSLGLNMVWEVFPVIIILSITIPFSSLPILGTSWSSFQSGSINQSSEMRERSVSSSTKPRVHEEKELSMALPA